MKNSNKKFVVTTVVGIWFIFGALAISAPPGQPILSKEIVGPFAKKSTQNW